jgi:CRP/FNR family transcriptional regulator, cyclic AMP receptor protein
MQGPSTYHGWETVYGLSDHHQVPAAAVLFRQDTMAQSAILLERGWIKLTRQERNGQEQIIALCPPGTLLGAEVLIAEQLHSATAITLGMCQLYLIPAMAFVNWVRTDPQFSWQIHRAFSRRIYIRDLNSTQLRGVPTRLRLEQLLWQLLYAQNYDMAIANSKWKQGKKKLFLTLQRQELAQMLSVTPEYLSRLLGKMEKEGIVTREKGWLIVPNPERLWCAPEIQALTGVDSTQRDVPDLPDIIIA